MPRHRDYGARVRIWDHPKTADRYTILPPRTAGDDWRGRGHEWQGICASPYPFHPQGVGMHIECPAGPHLGKRLHWHELPADVQRFARQTFPAAWLPQSED